MLLSVVRTPKCKCEFKMTESAVGRVINSIMRNPRNENFSPIINSIIHPEIGNMQPKKKQKTSNVRCENVEQPATSTEDMNDSTTDWRDKFVHVRDIHMHALENKYLTDVTFIVGEEKVPFSAHRMILALGSPVFEAMFFGGLAEKGEYVSIPDVAPKGFDCLLRFLYHDDLDLENDVVAFKTFFAADKYCVVSLKDRCETYLSRCKLKANNVWIFLESSLFLNSNLIKGLCLSFLKYSAIAALEDNSFLDVTTKTLETFLSLNAMNVSEMRLLRHVVRWAEHKSQSEPDPVDAFRNSLRPMLKLVRFYNLNHQDFVQFLEMPKLKDVLSDSDALAILKFIIRPGLCSLPDWCCKKIRHVVFTSESISSSCSKNEKQDDSSQCQNRNKRKRENPRKLEICDMTSSSSDSSDSSEAGTVSISSRSSLTSPTSRLSSDDNSNE